MTRLFRLILGLAAIGACLIAWRMVYLDSVEKAQQTKKKRPETPLAVEVIPVRVCEISQQIELVGSLEPLNEVEIRAKVSGYIIGLPFDLGDDISASKSAVLLDETEQNELIQQSEAALRVAEAELAAQRTTESQAKKQLQRIDGLHRKQAATLVQLEEAQTTVEVATSQVALQQARVDQAKTELSRVKHALNDLRMPSPIDGTVAARFVSLGDLAKPDTPLLRIVNLDTLQTTVHVVERDYEQLRKGQQATVTVDAWPGETFNGIVERVAPVIDPTTRTALVHLEIKNTNRKLKPGMYARVSITSDAPHSSTLVPITAIKEEGEETCVYVVAGTPPIATRHDVRTGMNTGTVVEIIKGVSEGDLVITLGSHLVHHGQEVTPVETTWPISLNCDGTKNESKTAAAK